MTTELTLPRIGTNMEEATITVWRKSSGETFVAGECLDTIETDKVTFDVEAPFDGTLLECFVPAGENASVGQAVGLVQERAP